MSKPAVSRLRPTATCSCLGTFVVILALASVLLTPDTSNAAPILNVDNGHYYEFIFANEGISWTDARDAAAASTHLGLTGYLATTTSLSEENFVEGLLPNASIYDYWLGGSDAATEGVWLWVTGPEAGTQFWQGGTLGSAVNSAYEDWQRFGGPRVQPDNGFGEDYLALEVAAGAADSLMSWNDLSDDLQPGYIVEYSPADVPVPEPASLTLLGLGLAGIAGRRWRQRKAS